VILPSGFPIDFGAVSGMNEWPVKPKYSEETCPIATLSITDPTCLYPASNLVRRCGKPATNRLSHGTALKHPQSLFLLRCQRPSLTAIRNNFLLNLFYYKEYLVCNYTICTKELITVGNRIHFSIVYSFQP
jgi:hypothetical protein